MEYFSFDLYIILKENIFCIFTIHIPFELTLYRRTTREFPIKILLENTIFLGFCKMEASCLHQKKLWYILIDR